MAGTSHFSDADVRNLHQPKGGASEKGCLTRHQSREQGHQCSHQWHAYVKAEDNAAMYNYPAYQTLCGEGSFRTGARISKKGSPFPPNYAMTHMFPMKKRPRPGQWDLGIKRNYLHFTKPYWHNAHHLIPNSTLDTAIRDVSTSDPRLYDLIRGGLLKGEYNLNGKKNMIILPMDQVVAEAMQLPRHLRGHESGPAPEYWNHPDYNQIVRTRIRPVMNEYKSLAAQALKDHPAVPNKLAADKLDAVSEEIFGTIRKCGPFIAGKSLDEMKFAISPRG